MPKNLKDFYGRDFLITEDVLMPRPETEMAIDAVLNLVGKPYLPGVKANPAKLDPKISILDVGAGSGCIAITLKLLIPEAEVSALDISDKALEVARKNAEKFNAEITFLKSALLENAKFIPDVIVANLPYVDENWDWINKVQLSKEPAIALYAEDHGLKLIKKLITQASARKIKYLVLEADPCQHRAIKKYAEENNYRILEIRDFILVLSY